MKDKIQYNSNDKIDWFKNHSLSEEERKKLIDIKLKKVYNQSEFNRKAREILTD